MAQNFLNKPNERQSICLVRDVFTSQCNVDDFLDLQKKFSKWAFPQRRAA